MSVDLSTLPTYTDAQMLAAIRFAIAQILVGGQSYQLMGRMFTRANLKELQGLEVVYQAKVDAADGSTVALARFNRLS